MTPLETSAHSLTRRMHAGTILQRLLLRGKGHLAHRHQLQRDSENNPARAPQGRQPPAVSTAWPTPGAN